jgi:hypothetical protein
MDPAIASDIEPAQLRPDLEADAVSGYSDQIHILKVLVVEGNRDASTRLEAIADLDDHPIKVKVNLVQLRGTVPPSGRNRSE